MLVRGALVNVLAFSGSNYLFIMLRGSGADEERKRHNKEIEQLQAAHEAWSRKRTERLDWIAEDLRRQGRALKTFRDVNEAMELYAEVTVKKVSFDDLGPEPQLSDVYIPSDGQKEREIAFVLIGMAATGLVAYELAKLSEMTGFIAVPAFGAVSVDSTNVVRQALFFFATIFCGFDSHGSS